MTLIAHWPLTGNPGDAEDGQPAYDIAGGGSGYHDGIYEVSTSEILGPWGVGGRHLNCNQLLSGYVHSFANLSDFIALKGEMTVCCWRRKHQGATSTEQGRMVCCGGAGETSDTNYQWQFETRANGALSLFWEYGAGSDVIPISATGILSNNGGWYHVAAVRYLITPGFFGVRYYVNGVLVDTQDNGGSGYPPPDGGSSSSLFIGRNTGGDPPAGTGFGIDSVRVYDTDESSNIATIYAAELPDHQQIAFGQSAAMITVGAELGEAVDVSLVREAHSGELGLQVLQGERSGRENAGFSTVRV